MCVVGWVFFAVGAVDVIVQGKATKGHQNTTLESRLPCVEEGSAPLRLMADG